MKKSVKPHNKELLARKKICLSESNQPVRYLLSRTPACSNKMEAGDVHHWLVAEP